MKLLLYANILIGLPAFPIILIPSNIHNALIRFNGSPSTVQFPNHCNDCKIKSFIAEIKPKLQANLNQSAKSCTCCTDLNSWQCLPLFGIIWHYYELFGCALSMFANILKYLLNPNLFIYCQKTISMNGKFFRMPHDTIK